MQPSLAANPFNTRKIGNTMSSNSLTGGSTGDVNTVIRDLHDPVGRLLKIADVCAETGLSRAMIYRLMTDARNPFPKPIKFGNASRWSLVEIIEWKAKALQHRNRLPDPFPLNSGDFSDRVSGQDKCA